MNKLVLGSDSAVWSSVWRTGVTDRTRLIEYLLAAEELFSAVRGSWEARRSGELEQVGLDLTTFRGLEGLSGGIANFGSDALRGLGVGSGSVSSRLPIFGEAPMEHLVFKKFEG